MSASDAAPLPRLGEVFFDVRGHSRTMRLSWYADTDVAVFSIWQGGKCTGTFRLPMDDLSRMIEILQRGPQRPNERGAVERGAVERGAVERGAVERGAVERGASSRSAGPGAAGHGPGGGHGPGYRGGHDADGEYTMVQGSGAAAEAEYDPGALGPGQYGSGQYRTGDYSSRDYGSPDYGSPDYGSPDYGSPDYGSPDYGSRDHGSRDHGNYGPADHYPDAGRRYEPGDYGRPAHRREDDRYQADVTGQPPGPADTDGYGQRRFVPPYVRPEPDASELGFFDDSEYGQPADPAGRSRHSAGRHSSGQGQ
jgi:hypothetical protein